MLSCKSLCGPHVRSPADSRNLAHRQLKINQRSVARSLTGVLAARRTSPALCTLIGSATLLRRSKSNLTNVELLWLEKRIENWIRFGPSAEEQILDKRRRGVSFALDS